MPELPVVGIHLSPHDQVSLWEFPVVLNLGAETPVAPSGLSWVGMRAGTVMASPSPPFVVAIADPQTSDLSAKVTPNPLICDLEVVLSAGDL